MKHFSNPKYYSQHLKSVFGWHGRCAKPHFQGHTKENKTNLFNSACSFFFFSYIRSLLYWGGNGNDRRTTTRKFGVSQKDLFKHQIAFTKTTDFWWVKCKFIRNIWIYFSILHGNKSIPPPSFLHDRRAGCSFSYKIHMNKKYPLTSFIRDERMWGLVLIFYLQSYSDINKKVSKHALWRSDQKYLT